MTDTTKMFGLFRRFAATMGTSFEVSDVLYELCDHAVDLLDATGAGVCVGAQWSEHRNDDGLRFVTATDERVAVLERAQEQLQEGPCNQAYRTGEICTVSALEDIDRWPEWTTTALTQGLASVVGIPLALEGRTVGALNVYDAKSRPWTGEELDAARVLADMAAAYLARAGELAEAQTLSRQLQRALDSRIIIEQAKGMLARDHGIDVDDAFDLLRRHARSTNAPLRDLANAIVHLGLHLPDRR